MTRESDEFVLVTGLGQGRPRILLALVAALALVVVSGLVFRLRHQPGNRGWVSVTAGGLIALTATLILVRQWEWWTARRRRRDRPGPALRLSATGLDYSPAFRGDWPVHVDWAAVRGSRFLRGPSGVRYWCLHAVRMEGLGPLTCTLDRRQLVEPGRARAAAIGQASAATAFGVPGGDLDLLTHLLTFGTPVAIDLTLVERATLSAADARLQEWTEGRCSLRRPRRLLCWHHDRG